MPWLPADAGLVGTQSRFPSFKRLETPSGDGSNGELIAENDVSLGGKGGDGRDLSATSLADGIPEVVLIKRVGMRYLCGPKDPLSRTHRASM